MKRLALAAAALTAAPGCAQEPAASPAPAAGGETAALARAIEQGDEAVLLRITRGSIYNRLTPEARVAATVRMSAGDLIAATRGCRADRPMEANSGPYPSDTGSVELRCDGRPAADDPCNDVGYGLLVRPQAGYARVEVWPAGGRSRTRCGEAGPPPPAPPPPPMTRTGV